MTPPLFGTYSGNSYWNNLLTSQSGVSATQSSGASSPSFLPCPDVSLFQNMTQPQSNLLTNGGFSPQLDSSVQGLPQEGLFNLVRNNPTLFLLFMQSLQQKQVKESGTTVTSDSQSAPAKNNSHFKEYNTKNGELLKESAVEVIQRRGSSVGKCAKGVRLAIEDALGEHLNGADAHKWGDKLAQRKDFKEIEVSGNDLKKLPAGAVVVWRKTDDSPYGHVSIASGDGQEISDHIEKQRTDLRGDSKCRVFIPV